MRHGHWQVMKKDDKNLQHVDVACLKTQQILRDRIMGTFVCDCSSTCKLTP